MTIEELMSTLSRICYGSEKSNNSPIKKVIFNPPATIVFWSDNSKTVVKAADEPFDPEKGLAMAIAKKALGNEGNYYNLIRKWTASFSADKIE